ncbi:MAG: undecaprenyldiphospho-muramoylpentapeptide beta-N-acetylglucosaminyltransferase [Abitibacteriaceae bacterium]|nr:undecaprenyldiphospho-muramoylpentapeptide beta-N-acetylglucosaminyltransferase [Abditibacteriaceae bacterium]
MATLKILVTGGGSSGHISPALAIIKTLQELAAQTGADWTPRFLYLGGKRGLEKDLVEKAGIPFVGVETGKLRRYLSRENLTDLFRIPVGTWQALQEVRNFRPDVVLATGGYVAVPPVIAAAMLRVPILIHEQTVQIGLANRITARFATRIALSFESAMYELPPALRHKAFVAGNPVRSTIFNGQAEEARRHFSFNPDDDSLPTLYVTGGSQGARILNRAVEAVLPDLLSVCRIIHQCGQQPPGQEQDYDRLQRAVSQLSPELSRRYGLTRFIAEELKHVFALADLVVGRAGAGTVSELCALGKPAIYVPLVPTGGDEQTRNAKMCQRVGAAIIIPQADFDGLSLLSEVKTLLADKSRLDVMGRAASSLAKPNAARDMAEAVLALVKDGGHTRR